MGSTETENQANPFESAEPWDVSLDGGLLPIGPHVVVIVSVEDETAGTNNPQLHLKFQNDDGAIQAWDTYHEGFLRKVVSLYQSAGLPIPQPGEFDPSDHCRLTAEKIAQLQDKRVGIVVRDEPDNRDPTGTRTQRRVAGYVDPLRIESEAPDTRGLPDARGPRGDASATAPSSSRPAGESKRMPF